MDARQVALKVTLDQLGEPSDIAGVDNRLRIQKAVYLAQAAGINLGYPYSWYVKGPYSPALTHDYYQLDEALRAGDQSHAGKVLNPALSAAIPRIRRILSIPQDLSVPKHTWYEALASLHFLLVSSKKDENTAKQFLNEVKPHLRTILERAILHLRNNGLIA
jgi:hypothetical protein